MKQRNLASLLLAGAMTAALLTGPAQAAESPSPQEIAATRLQAEGLMNGDEHGDLHLDKGLTRAELACLISPIVLNPEHVAWERDYYAKLCTTNFSDVPEWAQVAVGVCASMGVVAGYGDGRFGSDDPVSPQMACTIMLRYLERDGWTYVTACGKAVELGLAQAETLEGEDDDIILLDQGEVDVGELAYTAFILDMDTKHLCSEDCKGLCPGCGVNLNQAPCRCKKQADPRWAALEQLLNKN